MVMVTCCAAAVWPHGTALKFNGLGPMFTDARPPVPLRETARFGGVAQRAPLAWTAAVAVFAPALVGEKVALAFARVAPGAMEPLAEMLNSLSVGAPNVTLTGAFPTFWTLKGSGEEVVLICCVPKPTTVVVTTSEPPCAVTVSGTITLVKPGMFVVMNSAPLITVPAVVVLGTVPATTVMVPVAPGATVPELAP